MMFRSVLLEGEYSDEKHAKRSEQILSLRGAGLSYRDIAEKVGVDRSFACRVCKGKSGKSREYRYLRDFPFALAAKEAGFNT